MLTTAQFLGEGESPHLSHSCLFQNPSHSSSGNSQNSIFNKFKLIATYLVHMMYPLHCKLYGRFQNWEQYWFWSIKTYLNFVLDIKNIVKENQKQKNHIQRKLQLILLCSFLYILPSKFWWTYYDQFVLIVKSSYPSSTHFLFHLSLYNVLLWHK